MMHVSFNGLNNCIIKDAGQRFKKCFERASLRSPWICPRCDVARVDSDVTLQCGSAAALSAPGFYWQEQDFALSTLVTAVIAACVCRVCDVSCDQTEPTDDRCPFYCVCVVRMRRPRFRGRWKQVCGNASSLKGEDIPYATW